jgi:maleylacetate reductase
MRPFTYDALPGRIVFGAGTVAKVADEVAALGVERTLVIADAQAKTTADQLVDWLGRRCVGVFSEVRQHVPEELATQARRTAEELSADSILSVGGGSATGLSKAVAVASGLPIVAVPTTYAGSEMTPIYGVTGAHKVTGRDRRALPRVVIYDPELTVGLPPEVSGPSGFNALAHCVEALYTPASNPVVDLMAEEGIRALARALPVVVTKPTDVGARSDALYGAYLAGAALAVAGTALHHKLCHVLGGTFGLVHGDTNAVVLPHVVAFNLVAVPDVMARVAAALGRPAEAEEAPPGLRDLADAIGAPTSLVAIGMPAEGLAEAAQRTAAETGGVNPRPVDAASVLAILQAAYEGRRP